MPHQKTKKALFETALNERYREVLCQLINDYIATAGSIGSHQISKEMNKRLSPATIRNVLADLEEMGYLTQPHLSSGRLPTEKGIRYFVDTFVEKKQLSEKEQKEIECQYQMGKKDIRTLMQKTGQILASFSKHVGLVLTPKLTQTTFKHMEFLPLSRGRLLAIFVTQAGMVENQILEVQEEFTYPELEKMSNFCNAYFIGLTLAESKEKLEKEIKEEHHQYDRLLSKALLFSHEILENIQTSEMMVEGEAPFFQQAKELLSSLEQKNQLLKILDSCLNSPGVRIFIGSESNSVATKNSSLITATYNQGKNLLGTIGVMGPQNMNYSKVISIVDFTAKMVSDLLQN